MNIVKIILFKNINKHYICITLSKMIFEIVFDSISFLDEEFNVSTEVEKHSVGSIIESEALPNSYVTNCIPKTYDQPILSVFIGNETHAFDLRSCEWVIKN